MGRTDTSPRKTSPPKTDAPSAEQSASSPRKVDNSQEVSPSQKPGTLQGRVKWFNAQSGYGFIEKQGSTDIDLFVHHSALDTKDDQFRYLVEGEYVQYSVENYG